MYQCISLFEVNVYYVLDCFSLPDLLSLVAIFPKARNGGHGARG